MTIAMLAIIAAGAVVAQGGCSGRNEHPVVDPRRATDYVVTQVVAANGPATHPPACGDTARTVRTLVIFADEQCLSCLGLPKTMRDAGAGVDTSSIGLMTSVTDAPRVCRHLAREGLARVPVLVFEDTLWSAPWPTAYVWTLTLDSSRTRPARMVLVPRADSSMFH